MGADRQTIFQQTCGTARDDHPPRGGWCGPSEMVEGKQPALTENKTPVAIPDKMSFGDRLAVALALSLLPLCMLVFMFAFILWLPPLLMLFVYERSFTPPVKVINRSCGFHLFSAAVFVIALPLVLLSVTYTLVTVTWCLLLSLPVGLCAAGRTCRSLAALGPYAGRPGAMAATGEEARSPADELAQSFGYLWPWGDVVVALLGALNRQRMDECIYNLPAMLALIPLMKVTLLNPLLHELEEVFINQWSEPLDADADADADEMDVAPVQAAISNMICAAILEDVQADLFDAWPFAGFHPYPPEGRKSQTVAGVQMGLGGKVLMLSHTYMGNAYSRGHTPRSEHGRWTCITVMAQCWNPWYNLTGHVEVNLRHDGGLEHPMWLLADRKSFLAMSFLESVNRTFVKLGALFAKYLKTRPAWIRTPPCGAASDGGRRIKDGDDVCQRA